MVAEEIAPQPIANRDAVRATCILVLREKVWPNSGWTPKRCLLQVGTHFMSLGSKGCGGIKPCSAQSRK
jgi:hypothetical protein